MADSIQQQLAERRQREAQRHRDASTQNQNQNQNTSAPMEQDSQNGRQLVGVQSPSASGEMPIFRDHETVDAVEEVFRRINKHKSNLRELNQRKEEIEKQIVNEARALARDEEIMRRIATQATPRSQSNLINNENNEPDEKKGSNDQEMKIDDAAGVNNKQKTDEKTKNDDDVIMRTGGNNNNTNDNLNDNGSQPQPQASASSGEATASGSHERVLTQEEKDMEIALQMQRQYDREQDQVGEQQRQQRGSHRSFVFRSRPNGGGGTFHFSSDIPDQNSNQGDIASSMLDSFGPMMGMGMSGFGSSSGRGRRGGGGFGSGFGSSFDNGNDIFSQLDNIMGGMNNMNSINRMAFMGMDNNAFSRLDGMNGFVFGGGINPDNMSYEQLLQMFPNVPRGANETAIQALPTDEYKAPPSNNSNNDNDNNNNNENESKSKDNEKKETCSICLEEFENGDSIRRLPCLHIFHTDEIDRWLRTNHICPICRQPIDEEPQQQEQQQQPQQQQQQ